MEWSKLNIQDTTILNMKLALVVTVLLFFLSIETVLATTGTSPVEAYVNPCGVFLTQTSCEAAGCYWWDSSCHYQPSIPGGTVGPTPENITINIVILTESITTPGNFSFAINLTNERNYKIEGFLDYWIENHFTRKKYFEHTNETVMIPASSNITLERNIFLLLPVGDYFLKAEFTRTPIEIREKISDQKDFTVTSALGWYQTERPLDPAETAIIITFLILIIIFAYGVYTITSDFYSYTFSE